MDSNYLLNKTISAKASDLHITVGVPPVLRINGKLEPMNENKLTPQDTEAIVKQFLSNEQLLKLDQNGEIDFSFSIPNLGMVK